MRILAIDTATAMCSAALSMQGVVSERCRLVPQGHGEWILSMIDGLLQEANTTVNELDALAFGRGPGSFTGVRMAISIAQGLGFGAGLPLLPVSNLAMVAQGCFREHGCEHVLVAMDARMNEVYFAEYHIVDEGMTLLGEERLLPPNEPPAITGHEPVVAVGTGWSAYPELIEQIPVSIELVDDDRLPRAEDALPIACSMYQKGETEEVMDVRPTYLRNKVAWKK